MTVFVTESERDGHRYGGKVCARSWAEAQEIAAKRVPPERVVGELVQEIPWDGATA